MADTALITASKVLLEITAEDIVVANKVYVDSLKVLLQFKSTPTPSSVIDIAFPTAKREEIMQKAVYKIVRANIERWFSVIALTSDVAMDKAGHFIKHVLFLIYGQLYGEEEDGTKYSNQVHRNLHNLRILFSMICHSNDVESYIRERVFFNAQQFLFTLRQNTADDVALISDTLDTLSLLSVVTNETAMRIYADMLEGGYDVGDTELIFQYFDESKFDVDGGGPVYLTTWHDWITKKPGGHVKTTSPFPGNVALLFRDKINSIGWKSGPVRLGVTHTTPMQNV